MGYLNIAAQSPIDFAAREIFNSLGVNTAIRRKSLHKFGRNDSAGTSEEVVCWDGITPYLAATNVIDTVSSTNTGDTTQTLRVEGMYLDGNSDFVFSFQDVSLNGQNPVTLTQPLCRVTRIANIASTTATAGDVYVYDGTATAGVPDDMGLVGNIMSFEDQSTLYSGTSIASGNYFLITGFFAYVGKKTSAGADIRLRVRHKDSVFRTVRVVEAADNHGVEERIEPYIIIPPNSDIQFTSTCSTTNVDVLCGFDGYFADII